MKNTLARPADDIERIVYMYGNMLFRLCLITLGNAADAEDIVQETLIKYLQKEPDFENEEHEKAWFIKVATNKCKDALRFKRNHPVVNIEEINELTNDISSSGILDALMSLPDKFRIVLVLYYVEECSIKDIAKVIGRTKSAVKMRLQKGRRLLREVYGREYM